MSRELKLSAPNLSQRNPQDITVEIVSSRRHTHGPTTTVLDNRGLAKASCTSDYIYVNSAYVGSVNSLHESRLEPPTSVIREQYWACSRWPFAQRILALAVGVLVGAVIGLALTMALKNKVGDTNIIGGLLRNSAPD